MAGSPGTISGRAQANTGERSAPVLEVLRLKFYTLNWMAGGGNLMFYGYFRLILFDDGLTDFDGGVI